MKCKYCDTEFEPKRPNQFYCARSCVQKAFYRNNPDKMKAKRVKQRKASVEKYILSRIKSRAKSKNIQFDLEESDIKIPETCPVLGIPLSFGISTGFNHSSPSVDRVDPRKGYVKTNIRIISWRANLLKSDASADELEKVLNDLKEIRKCE
jgi:hypothetical protein